ncbi:MAG: hypothetical protein AAF600_10945 [Bacteroidota bacterium]
MIAAYPNNDINRELKARLNNLDVGGTNFRIFDSRVTTNNIRNYILISTQLNQPEFNKCGDGWENSTEIQIIVRSKKNQGSKALLNQAAQSVLDELQDFSLPVSTGLAVNSVVLSDVNELVDDRGSEIVYQKILRMETSIR